MTRTNRFIPQGAPKFATYPEHISSKHPANSSESPQGEEGSKLTIGCKEDKRLGKRFAARENANSAIASKTDPC